MADSDNEVGRWADFDAAEAAQTAFLKALDALLRGNAGPAELTDAEVLARRLGSYLGATVALGVGPGWTKTFRAAIALFERDESLTEKRCRAVQAVAAAGDEYLRVSNNEGRQNAVVGLARALEALDESLDGAFGELDRVPLVVDLMWLEQRLAAYDPSPKGKAGKKGPESVLAEILALDLDAGALGLISAEAAEEEDAQDTIERYRKALTKAVAKTLSDSEAAET